MHARCFTMNHLEAQTNESFQFGKLGLERARYLKWKDIATSNRCNLHFSLFVHSNILNSLNTSRTMSKVQKEKIFWLINSGSISKREIKPWRYFRVSCFIFTSVSCTNDYAMHLVIVSQSIIIPLNLLKVKLKQSSWGLLLGIVIFWNEHCKLWRLHFCWGSLERQ